MSLPRYLAFIFLLAIILLTMGSTTTSSGIEPLDQHVIHLPLIEKHPIWSEECIDCPHAFWGRSLDGAQLDSTGRIHVAYGGEQLYYGHQNVDGQWSIQVVDEEPNTGSGASLGLDSADRPHIIYLDDDNDILKYAFQTESGWQSEELPIQSDSPSQATIVIDSSDRPHIAFTSYDDVELYYSSRDADEWQTVVVDTNARDISLALDNQDHPHLVYLENLNDSLKYAHYDGSEWTISVIGESGNGFGGTSLVMDSGDNPHVSFTTQISHVKYAYQVANDWQIETVAEEGLFGGTLGNESSLKLDQSGTPYVAYTDLDFKCVRSTCTSGISGKYRESEGNWSYVSSWLVDNYSTKHGTLLIDASDGIHLVYHHGSRDELRAATVYPDGLETTIDVSGFIEHRPELVSDRENRLHASYYKSGLWIYTDREAHGWESDFVEMASDRSNHTDIAVGPDDEIYFAYPGYYYIGFQFWETFWLAKRAGSAWIKEEIGDIGSVWAYDINVDSQGSVHLGAFGSSGLRYWFEPTQDPPQPIVVDPEPGSSMAMVLDDTEQPNIAYGANPYGLKYARRIDDEWQVTVVDEIRAYSISLVLDSAGRPHIAYFNQAHEIRHAFLNGGEWQFETVSWMSGSLGDYGSILSMVIDQHDRLHLSYPGVGNAVVHAYRDDSGWSLENLETRGVTRFTRITLDSQDRPHIAYTDPILGDLRIIHYTPY